MNPAAGTAEFDDLVNRISARLRLVGLKTRVSVIAQLAQYYDELRRWNERVNLTALPLAPTGTDSSIDRLLVEPMVATAHIPSGSAKLLDVGSGGGSPAVPIKIALPDMELHMAEVRAKKVVFLRHVARRLGLSHTHVVQARVEDLAVHSDFAGRFDTVSVRAVRFDGVLEQALSALTSRPGHVLWFTTRGSQTRHMAGSPWQSETAQPLVPENRSELIVMRSTQS